MAISLVIKTNATSLEMLFLCVGTFTQFTIKRTTIRYSLKVIRIILRRAVCRIPALQAGKYGKTDKPVELTVVQIRKTLWRQGFPKPAPTTLAHARAHANRLVSPSRIIHISKIALLVLI